MPVATPEIYAQMLDTAKENAFAFPAINVSSSQTLNAALKGFADAESDGIIQISTGGAEYLSGPSVKNMVSGSVALAAYAAEVARNYPVNVALHTDHCPKDKLDGFVRPLLDISAERVARGEAPLFQSHMWDGSAVPLDENLQIAQELLAKCAAAHIVLEVEIGVVGGEEDGVEGAIDEKLYTTPQDALDTVAALGLGDKGRYLTALTFGNVHGVYKPGNVKLRLLQDLGAELDVAGLVDAVHVAEGERGQVAALVAEPERLDGVERVLRRRVELLVDLSLDAVLLAADDADLDLEDDLRGRALGEQLLGDLQVLLQRYGGPVPHVRLEQRRLAAARPAPR